MTEKKHPLQIEKFNQSLLVGIHGGSNPVLVDLVKKSVEKIKNLDFGDLEKEQRKEVERRFYSGEGFTALYALGEWLPSWFRSSSETHLAIMVEPAKDEFDTRPLAHICFGTEAKSLKGNGLVNLILTEVTMTQGIAEGRKENPLLEGFIMQCLARYVDLDFGDICQDDEEVNYQAVKDGSRILGSYNLPEGIDDIGSDSKVWIISEAVEDKPYCHRLLTTILLPSEY